MNRILLIFLLLGAGLHVSGQKSRVMAVMQMIDQSKFDEAKESIELASWNDNTSRWPRTYYAKGLLCQTAYEAGYKTKDAKLTGLYPDQLYVAYAAYEKALDLDVRKKLEGSISKKYYSLSNDFRRLGKEHFTNENYVEALRAFESALLINNSDLVKLRVDTNLVYNTALAAYESEDWETAINYLTGLHDDEHGYSTSLLLYSAHMANMDSLGAENILLEAVEMYEYERQVVVYLINLYVETNRPELALKVLEDAILDEPDNYLFYWGKGLIYRRMGQPKKAIADFKAAIELAPQNAKLYYHLGVVYYNMGVDLRQESLGVADNVQYRKMREKAREELFHALKWLEKSYELNPFDEKTISKLQQLYYQLQMKQKEESMKLLID
jgi:tetratricopeptide (TPR) repeat protein